jgi:hypothetical protein
MYMGVKLNVKNAKYLNVDNMILVYKSSLKHKIFSTLILTKAFVKVLSDR